MKRLAIYLHPYLGRIGLGFTIKFMGTLLDLMIPWMLSTIIDEVIPTGEFQRVLLWGCMMLLCSAAVFAFNVIPNRMASAVARDVTEEVRRDLYQKATLLSCAQMDRITIPSVISRLTTDTYNLHRMIGMMQRLGVRAPILLLGGLIVTMSMEPRLGAVLLAMLPFMGLTIWLILRKGIPMYSVTQKKVDRMIQVVRESVTGIRIIKALSKTDYESGRFDKISKDLSDQEQTASITMATTNPLMNLYLNSGLVIVILLGAYMVYSGTTQIGRIIAFQSYFTIILNAVISISRMFVIYSKGSASADRIQEILELPEELQTIPGDPEKDPKAAPDEFLAFDHVSFSYLGQKDNLTNISFTLKRGESLGIIGATGSGKSTIARWLYALINYSNEFNSLVDRKLTQSFNQQIKRMRRILGNLDSDNSQKASRLRPISESVLKKGIDSIFADNSTEYSRLLNAFEDKVEQFRPLLIDDLELHLHNPNYIDWLKKTLGQEDSNVNGFIDDYCDLVI